MQNSTNEEYIFGKKKQLNYQHVGMDNEHSINKMIMNTFTMPPKEISRM